MGMFGGWEAKFSKNFPQKVASAISGEIKLLGASYDAKAYLGLQPVNGVNHAVLAEQTLENGRDTKNAVMLIYNEKLDSMDVSLAAIKPISQSGGAMGGMRIDVSLDIPEEAKKAFKAAFEGWVGAKVTPVAYLGSQLVNGMNYEMIVEFAGIAPNQPTDLVIVTVNDLHKSAKFRDLFEKDPSEVSDDNRLNYWIVKGQKASLGYAFTW